MVSPLSYTQYGESLVPCMEPIEYHRGLRGLGTRLERVMHEVIVMSVYIIYLHGDRSSPKVMHEVSHALYMATEPCVNELLSCICMAKVIVLMVNAPMPGFKGSPYH